MPARVAVAALRLPSDAPRLPAFAQQRPMLPSASRTPAADLHAICRRDIRRIRWHCGCNHRPRHRIRRLSDEVAIVPKQAHLHGSFRPLSLCLFAVG